MPRKTAEDRIEKFSKKFDEEVVKHRYAAVKPLAQKKQAEQTRMLTNFQNYVRSILNEHGVLPIHTMPYLSFAEELYRIYQKYGISQTGINESNHVTLKWMRKTSGINFELEIVNRIRNVFGFPDYSDPTPVSIKAEITNFPSEYPLPSSQVENLKEVEVTNLPSSYPLPSEQVENLKKVEVTNLPSEYPLPSEQVSSLKSVEVTNLLNPHPIKFSPEDRILNENQYSGTYAPSSSGSTTIISAVANKVIRIYDFYLWNSGDTDVGVRLYFATSGKNLFKGKLASKTGVMKTFLRAWQSNTGDSLMLYLDAAGNIDYGVAAVQA